MASELKPCLSAFVKWTKQHRAHWNLSPVYINGQFSKFMDPDTDTAWMGFEAAWNTRPAPAATDTGLVTAMTVRVEDAGDAGITAQVDDLITEERGLLELVTRSQAVELLAAKDAEILQLLKELRTYILRAEKAEADNAAKVARIKELAEYAREATKAITGLTGGGSENFGKPIGEFYPADLTFCVERIRERIGSKRDRLRTEIATKRKIDAALYHISEIEGCAGEFIQTPCRSLKDRLLQAINRARVALEDDKDGSGGGLRG